MKKKIIAAIMTGLVCLSTITGCGNTTENTNNTTVENEADADKKSKEPIELTFYQFQAGIVDQIQEICDEFNEQHPDIKVIPDRPGDDYFNMLKTMFASNQGPDIYSINAWTMVGDYAKSGNALDLSQEDFVKNVPQEALTSVTVDEKVYALPMESAALGILYNKAIFEKNDIQIPTTLTELEAVCTKLQAAGVDPFMVPVKETWMLRHIWSMIHTPSVSIVDFVDTMNQGTGSFKNDKSDDAFRTLDILTKYNVKSPFDYDYNTACAYVGEGKAAMYPTGLWALDMIKQMDPAIEMGIFPMPISDNKEDTKLSVDNNSVYCINAKSEHTKEAMVFLNWLAEKKNAQTYADKTKTIPVIKDVLAFEGADPAYVEALSYSMDGGTAPWGFSIWPAGYDEEAGTIIQTYMSGELSKEEALNKLDSKWADFIK